MVGKIAEIDVNGERVDDAGVKYPPPEAVALV
jgi:hypothetical protein